MTAPLIVKILSSFGAIVATIAHSFFGLTHFATVYTSTTATIENEPPTVPYLSVSGNSGLPSSSFERTIFFTGTIDDRNGDMDIASSSLVVYRGNHPLAEHCHNDPNQCYRVENCLLDRPAGSLTEASFTCSISLPQAYSYGAWTAYATAEDYNNATGTGITTFQAVPFTTSSEIGFQPPEKPQFDIPLYEIMPSEQIISQESPEESREQKEDIPSVDPITKFYERIEKLEPAIRFRDHHTESYNTPLRIASLDTGLAVFDLSTEPNPTRSNTLGVIIELPAGTSKTWITVHVESILIGNRQTSVSTRAIAASVIDSWQGIKLGDKVGISPVGFTAFNIYAKDSEGRTLYNIDGAARITLVVPEDLTNKKDLGLYRLDFEKEEWVEEPIVEHDDYTVVFRTSKFGVFAIFDNAPIEIETVEEVSTELYCKLSLFIFLLIFTGIILLMIITIARGKKEEKLYENTIN